MAVIWDGKGPCAITNKGCSSGARVCIDGVCFAVEINPFLLRSKTSELKLQNGSLWRL